MITLSTEPTVTETPAVVTGNEEVATQAQPVTTETPHVDKVDEHEEAQESVSLKLWAKTNKANRELSAKVAEFEAKTREFEAKLAAQPAATPTEDALLEMLKAPGAAKKLLSTGKTFEQIISELTDVETVDPVLAETQSRIARLEEERRAEKEQSEKDRQAASERERAAQLEAGQREVLSFAKNHNVEVTDESDPRYGTERYAIVSGRPDLIETARDAVVEFLKENYSDKAASEETVNRLVHSALDQIEIEERQKLLPLVQKIQPKQKPPTRAQTLARQITADSDPFGNTQSEKPRTITADLRQSTPVSASKGRYQGGPRRISYAD